MDDTDDMHDMLSIPQISHPIRAPIAATVQSALTAPGDLDPAIRAAILDRAMAVSTNSTATRAVPDPLAALVDKITRHAYKVADDDVQILARAGYSQDATFEALVSAAIGAGMARLASGLSALEIPSTGDPNSAAGESAS